MKIINLKYIFLITGISLFSCEDKLNVEPTLSISEEAALKSEDNVKKLLIGVYEIAGNRDSYGGYIQLFSDLLGSENQVSWDGTFAELREAYTKKMFATNFLVGEIWNNQYKIINQSNIVLDHLSVIQDEAERNRVEGEALFLRSLSYFDLVRMYGSATKGVPIRAAGINDFAIDLNIARVTPAENYTRIIEDLTKAISLLPDDNDFYTDKYSALALLARVNLYKGDYEGALNASNEVIESSGKSLSASFADAFNHDEDNEEDIFSMQVTSQSGQNQMIQMYASEGNGGRGGDVVINTEYLDLFNDANDERGQFVYTNEAGATLSSKYTNQFGNVPILRLAEMYLIRAEANLNLGSEVGSAPLDDLNTIRARSGAAPRAAATLDAIILERQLELAFEGFFIYDIKRTQASVQGIAFDSPSLVMPIPQSEMDTNTLMEQNEGY